MKKKIIINIGRQFGSGGLAVAKALSAKLGIPVYDREIIAKAADDSGFSTELFAEKDEKRSFFSLSSFFSSNFGSADQNYMSNEALFNLQCEAIKNIAEQGSAIIVGRCSNYVLRNFEGTLNVFLTSPDEIRAQRVSERSGISVEKATSLIKSNDKTREEYYNYFTFGNWGVASTYDLCLDSSILGIEGTADFIISFARKAGLL